jgi:hypothetical protein
MNHLTKRICRTVCVGLLLTGFAIAGCGYGEVSHRGYEHATALYAICNRRDVERLEKYAALVESELVAGDISRKEADWMRAIVAQARSGEWQAASSEVRQLMEDQVDER